TGNAVVCGGASTTLGISGATIGTGMSYQWQSSPDSLSWTNVLGATSASYSPSITSDSIYFRCTLQCSAGTPANTPAYIVKADIFKVTVLTPYNEGFESISANNQLPSCMSATNLGSVTYTYLLPTGSYNQAARTGSKYGSFRYSCNDFFFSKGLKLTQGVNYSFSTWFVTDGYTGSWDSVSLYVATAPNSSSVTLLPGATLIQPSNITYQQLMGSFTPSVTGVYNLAFKVKDAGIPWYLSIDDISVTESSAPVVASGTKTNITTNSVTLAGNIISNGGGTISASGVVVSTSSSPARGGFGVTDSATNPLATSGVFTVNIAGLNLGTLYHYRAYAVNGVGTSYGADSTFTTNAAAVAPTVVKIAATNLTAYAAKLGGNITSDGGSPVFISGIVYATTSNPTLLGIGVVDSVTNPGVTLGTYYIYPVGLLPGTKYYFRAYATNAMGTAYSIQDSFLTSPVVATFPYLQNFDSVGNTGWSSIIVNGTLNDWVLGTPAKTYLNSSFSPPNSWVTLLTGSYDNNIDAAVLSPQFNFSAITADPILRFKHNFVTETGWDALVVEVSINGGAWTKLDATLGTGTNYNTTNSVGWYNSSSTSGPITPPKFSSATSGSGSNTIYSSLVSGWVESTTAITGAAGQANVKVRFRFGSDGSGVYEGWALDNIEVFTPTAPTVITGTKSNLTTNSATLAANITGSGNATITASGVVISTSSSPVRGGLGVVDSATNPLTSIGTFSVNVTGLMVATTYYYRAYAVNGIGTSYGADSTFTTNASAVAPTVVKNAATNVTTTTATIGGNITSDGGSPVFLSGVVYATTSNPVQFGIGVVDSMTNPVVSMGSFSIYPTGLLPGTKYYYKAYAINAMGTSYSTQDSFITSPLVSTFPYFQNFDGAGNTGWSSVIVNGTINEWVVGTPAKVQLTAAYSAPKCWVTKLSGNYSDNQDAAVVSPQFDFSALTNDPVLSFRHNFITEAGWDAAVIEVSTNGGTNWKRVDSTLGTGTNFNSPNSYSWYNNTSTSGPMVPSKWSGNSNLLASNVSNWLLSQTRLTGMAGQSNVKIRIRFASDASGNDDGWAFDDVRVVALTTPTTQASAVTINTITATSMHVSWTNGNGSSRMVVAYPTSSIGVDPSNWKMYNSSTAFRSGDSTGTDNFVIYNGTGSTVTTTALTLFTNYTFNVYEYNGSLMHVIFNTPGTSNSATTLPVKLLSFTGSKMNEDVLLNWKTSTEINNSGFEIERSIDGSHFEFVKFVRGAGNSSTVKNYNAIDEKAFDLNNASVLYYRLKQIDVDGKFEYSKIITVRKSDISVKNNINVYPNPSNGLFNIGIVSATEGQATVIITDVKGQEISSSIVQLSKGLTTSQSDVLKSVSNGIYFVKVIMNDEIIVTRISKVN
ncbi:MAG: T9SS type A sorting domain-containing protein, partial [Bacteroidota bacterium]